jgi:hypothetical protein
VVSSSQVSPPKRSEGLVGKLIHYFNATQSNVGKERGMYERDTGRKERKGIRNYATKTKIPFSV